MHYKSNYKNKELAKYQMNSMNNKGCRHPEEIAIIKYQIMERISSC